MNKLSILFGFFAIILSPNIAFCQNKIDSTLIKTAINTEECVQNAKKYIGKEIVLHCGIVASTEWTNEKEKLFLFLEVDDYYPNNLITVVISEEDADLIGFSRYMYHKKKVLIKGKLEKNKAFKDNFGNPRLVINIKELKQIIILGSI